MKTSLPSDINRRTGERRDMDAGDLIGMIFENTQPEKVSYDGVVYEFDPETRTYTSAYGIDLFRLIVEQVKTTGLKVGETRIELIYEFKV